MADIILVQGSGVTVIAEESDVAIVSTEDDVVSIGSEDDTDINISTLSMDSAESDQKQVGQLYSQSNVASGGSTPYSYALSAGALPSGVTLDSDTGLVSGTPLIAGIFSYSIRVTDDDDNDVTRDISGTIIDNSAPYDAESYNNIVVNGGVEIDQEHDGAAISGNGTYPVDGWSMAYGGTMVISGQRVSDAPPGFANSIKLSVTTAQATITANDYAQLVQVIEANRCTHTKFGTADALPLTLAFWTKIHRTGNYSGTIWNGQGSNRTYLFSFTQNVADTWEYKTITIPGDVTGTWVGTGSGFGLSLRFAIAMGTTYTGPANVWSSDFKFGVTGTINGVAALTDTFQITGVTLLTGSIAPTTAQSSLLKRSYDRELAICQRYYKIYAAPIFFGYQTSGGGFYHTVFFNPPMRVTPTMVATEISYVNASDFTTNFINATLFRSSVVMTTTGAGYAAMVALSFDARF